jgi:hypothetical protein
MMKPVWPTWPSERTVCGGIIAGKGLKIELPTASFLTKKMKRLGQWLHSPFLKAVVKRSWEGMYIDVGAEFGLHTLVFSHCCPSTSVLSVEPWRPNFDVLKVNAMQSPKIKAINAYFAYRLGNIEAFGEVLKMVRLDDYLEEAALDQPVAFIRMDASMGGGNTIGRGAVKTIERYRPALALEFFTHGEDLQTRRWAKAAGYRQLGTYGTTPQVVLFESE